MASEQEWAESDISCPRCRSTNLADLGAGPDPCRHLIICKDCGHYFEYPPPRHISKGKRKGPRLAS